MLTSITQNVEEAFCYDQIIQIDNHTCVKNTLAIKRNKLFSRRQLPYESLDQYLTELNYLSINCGLQQLREEIVRDIFICGLLPQNRYIREKLLQENKRSLSEVLELAKKLKNEGLPSQQGYSNQGEERSCARCDGVYVCQRERSPVPRRKSLLQFWRLNHPASKQKEIQEKKSFECVFTRSGRLCGLKLLRKRVKTCRKS